jgi:hypothetical protein
MLNFSRLEFNSYMAAANRPLKKTTIKYDLCCMRSLLKFTTASQPSCPTVGARRTFWKGGTAFNSVKHIFTIFLARSVAPKRHLESGLLKLNIR